MRCRALGLWLTITASVATASQFPAESATTSAIRAGSTDISKGQRRAVLDARVGVNVRLGDDPAALPATQLGQAEPHIYRSATDHLLLLATFQEGRYSDGGSIDCGYAISHDGGLTWTRALIPQLTQASGGRFNRATDPVAAIGPQGDLYLNTLGSTSGVFNTAAVVVSRSTDQGVTWSQPSVVFETTSTQVMPDKNWMAVNDFAASPNSGRLVVTWTNFTSAESDQEGGNLLSAFSDDRGTTWSTPVAITPSGSSNQGTQPMFLPDGTLLVVYISFVNNVSATLFNIECKRSSDGGRTFPANSTMIAAAVNGWDDPDLRDGVFLPSAAVARQSGAVAVTYTAIVNGTPRVLVTRSADSGNSWSQPVVVSDNPTGSSVANPAIALTPDGQSVSVAFIDKRNASDGHNFMDIYAAQSFDGGSTWQPNLRLTDLTSDIRNGPLTTRGYMFGDYMAIAPALSPDEPCVAIWCDPRTGDSDPFTVRFTPTPTANYDAWRIARFNPGDANGQPGADSDSDSQDNSLEFVLGSNPRVAESGQPFFAQRTNNGASAVVAVRAGLEDLIHIVPIESGGSSHVVTRDNSAVPTIDPGVGLRWVGFTIAGMDPVTLRVIADPPAGAPGGGLGATTAAGTDGRLINVSSRAAVGANANALIVGFAIDGPKAMLVRGAGPALAAFGISDAVSTPQLTLTTVPAGATPLGTSTKWNSTDTPRVLFSRLGAFPFPTGSNDTAILQTLPAGTYSGVMTGVNGATGPALVEAYDADPTPGAPNQPRILNLSTRANVATGTSTLIAGFFLSGGRRQILLRAVGPSLATFNVPGAIGDPVLSIYRAGTSTPLATNDDWTAGNGPAAVAVATQHVGAFGLNSSGLDAALLITLDPGGYTVAVTGVSASSGVALVEVYDAD